VLKISGNVGIGTAAPTQKLDVAGYVKGQTGLCIGSDCRSSWPSDGGGVSTYVRAGGCFSGDTIFKVRELGSTCQGRVLSSECSGGGTTSCTTGGDTIWKDSSTTYTCTYYNVVY